MQHVCIGLGNGRDPLRSVTRLYLLILTTLKLLIHRAASNSKDYLLHQDSMMAMQEAIAVPAHSAQVVGNAFVEQYYHVLHISPAVVYRFYQESSLISRPDSDGNTKTVTSMQAIDEMITSLNYEDYKAEIETADAQDSYEKGVIVLVTGLLTGKDNVQKKSAQTFFLAPQDKGYYVRNDVLRFAEEKKSVEVSSGMENGSSDNAPTAPLTPDPAETAHFPDHRQLDSVAPLKEETYEAEGPKMYFNSDQGSNSLDCSDFGWGEQGSKTPDITSVLSATSLNIWKIHIQRRN